MGRAKCILQNEFAYNISARCINKEWFELPMREVWRIFCDGLAETVDKHNLAVHLFVLMSNHYHLIASTPDSNISDCMQHFGQRTSRRLTLRGNRINQTFAGRHYKCILQSPIYFMNAYKYNYRNPVKAGICRRVEDYPFSTLRALLNKTELPFALVQDTKFLADPAGTLAWLNTPPTPEQLEAFRCGTHRQFFKSKKCPTTRRLILGPNDIL